MEWRVSGATMESPTPWMRWMNQLKTIILDFKLSSLIKLLSEQILQNRYYGTQRLKRDLMIFADMVEIWMIYKV